MLYYIVMINGFVSRGSSKEVWINKNFEYAKAFYSEEEATIFAKNMLKHYNKDEQFFSIIHKKEVK